MIERRIEALAVRVGKACLRRGVTLATAESCTAGGLAEAITAVSGSSAWFDRGFVTYSNESKEELLGVPRATLAAHGAVSEAVVHAMARGALERSRARVAIAITGIAGPTGATPGKPVGTVWFCWAVRDGRSQARRLQLAGGRRAVRRGSVAVALEGLAALLR